MIPDSSVSYIAALIVPLTLILVFISPVTVMAPLEVTVTTVESDSVWLNTPETLRSEPTLNPIPFP